MGYNIGDTSGNSTGGPDQWTFTLDLSTGATTVSGDFDETALFGGGSQGEADDGYTYSSLSTDDYGTIVTDGTDGTFTFTVDKDAVLDTGSDQTVTLTITGSDGGNSDEDTIIINILICVARGTRISTDAGPVPVEDLRIGDRVKTLDGPSRPIRWIGSTRLGPADLLARPEQRPIRISAGALGRNRPSRDLLVSPQHRVYLKDWRAELLFRATEVLVPAKSLLNDCTIRVDASASEVEYFHVLFDRHEIMFTEGAPTESFHPGAYSLREMSEVAREDLFAVLPHLRTGEDYGATARALLKAWEAELLTRDTETKVSAMAMAS